MKVIVSYQTLQLPPPYSFAYTLDLSFDDDAVVVKFEQEYLNRDTLSEEEILNEGFTTNDDISWSGTLGKVWADHFSKLFEDVQLQDESDEERLYIHMAVGNGKPGMVIDTDFWEYELQEIVQAIYEASGRESGLHMDFLVVEDGDQQKISIDGSFEDRKARIDKDQPTSWDNLRKIMSLTYNEDYAEEGVKKPDEDGIWVDFDGEGYYYRIPNKSTESELMDLIL